MMHGQKNFKLLYSVLGATLSNTTARNSDLAVLNVIS